MKFVNIIDVQKSILEILKFGSEYIARTLNNVPIIDESMPAEINCIVIV